jgi:xanthine dehydrogenase accessory protein XdhC
MMDTPAAAIACLDRGEPAVLVTVSDVLGSAPREAGAAMLVTADAIAGTIGGGHLEWRAIEAARGLLLAAGAESELALPLGPALTQCCGGHVRLKLHRLVEADRVALEQALVEQAARGPLLALFGAGHVGRAVVRALEPLPCRILWIDGRSELLPTEATRHVTPRVEPQPEAAVKALPPGAFVLVMTHSHPLDLDIVEAALRRADLAWVGLIGSDTKRKRFESQLRARGVAKAAVERLVCPIGIAGILGKEPAVIAASATAQLLIAFETMARRDALRSVA